MKKAIKQLRQNGKEVKLTKLEHDNFKILLKQVIKEQPVRKMGIGRHIIQSVATTFYSLFLTKNYMFAKIIIMITLFAGGGTAVAAEKALPGDVLYPVKLRVNEQVRSAISINSESKVQWDIRRAERRLEELVQLKIKGILNSDVQATVEEKFEINAKRAEERISNIEKKDPEKANRLRAEFEARLKAQENFFDSTDYLIEVKSILPVLRSRINVLEKIRVDHKDDVDENFIEDFKNPDDSSNNTDNSNISIRLTARYDELSSEMRSVQMKVEEKSDGSVKVRLMAHLETAIGELSEAKASIRSGAYARAEVSLNNAHRLIEQVKAALRIMVNVNSSIEGTFDADFLKTDASLNLDSEKSDDETNAEITNENNLRKEDNVSKRDTKKLNVDVVEDTIISF